MFSTSAYTVKRAGLPRAAQVQAGLGVGANRVVFDQRVLAEVAHAQARFPDIAHQRHAELACILDRARDVLAVRAVDVARMAARPDCIDRDPRQWAPERDELRSRVARVAAPGSTEFESPTNFSSLSSSSHQ